MTTRNSITLCFLFFSVICFAQLQITSPATGQTVYKKSILSINWEPGSNVDFVKIEYLNNGYTNLITNSTPNDGQYSFDLHPHSFSINSIAIKITAVNDSRNYTIASNLLMEECPISVLVIAPNIDLCIGQSVTFINNTTNATSYNWKVDDKTVSTSKNYTFTPTSLNTFNIRMEASNSNCYDYTYFDVVNTPTISDDNPCNNETVIEEMMIGDNGEIARMTAEIPIVLNEPVKAVAIRITHELENSKEFLYWDWSKQAIPGFNVGNIDKSVKDKVTVMWTSENPEGTLISGELYTLVYEITNMMAPEVTPVLQTGLGRNSKGPRVSSMAKPTMLGKEKLKYKKVTANGRFMENDKVKTTGVILTKDNIIILEQ